MGTTLVCDWAPPTPAGESGCETALGLNDENIIVEVRDPQGAGGRDEIALTVTPTESPVVSIVSPELGGSYYSDQPIGFKANISDAEDLADLSADLTSFDDLVECPEDVLRRTLEHCDTATIATALFGTTVQLQQRVLQVLGQKRSSAVESALLNPSPVRLGDIDMCRQRVLRPDAA